MRPRLVWNRPEWSRGAIVSELPRMRAAYGERLGAIAELYADIRRDLNSQPTTQDRKHTLERIIDAPSAAQVDRLDADTDEALLYWAHRLFRQADLTALPAEQLTACARAALGRVQRRAGPREKDRLAVCMVRELLAACSPHMTRRQRLEMLELALDETKVSSSDPRTIRRLLRLAGESAGQIN